MAFNTYAKSKGRTESGSFLGIPQSVIDSTEFRSLKSTPVKLLVFIAEKYKGSNNGDLSASYDELRRLGFGQSATISNALKVLQKKNFIFKTRQGGKNKCNLFAITWVSIDKPLRVGEYDTEGFKQMFRQRKKKKLVVLPRMLINTQKFYALNGNSVKLLIFMIYFYNQKNNGLLTAEKSKMRRLGWTSSDTLSNAKKELVRKEFLYVTRQGGLSNDATWYALTWRSLDESSGYDAGIANNFKIGSWKK